MEGMSTKRPSRGAGTHGVVAYRPESFGSTGYSVRPVVVDRGSGPIISLSIRKVAAGAAKLGTGAGSGAGQSGSRFAHGCIIGGSGPQQFWVALRECAYTPGSSWYWV